MEISLKEIDKQNYCEIGELNVSKEQEGLLAPNVWSLLEYKFEDDLTVKAIYLNKKPVGFLMWGQETTEKISIWRFMVDQKFQAQGIGRKALKLALEEIKATPNVKLIEICYDPKNSVAKEFYSSFGFIETELHENDHDMLAMIDLSTNIPIAVNTNNP
ncbi:MAG: GNAT family N-acetyltransferase [Nitratireductor sp.]